MFSNDCVVPSPLNTYPSRELMCLTHADDHIRRGKLTVPAKKVLKHAVLFLVGCLLYQR